MIRLVFAVTASLLWLGAASVAATAEQTYTELVAKGQRGDPTVDYAALRLSYIQSAGYDLYIVTRGPYLAALKAFLAKDCVLNRYAPITNSPISQQL